jgi:hypothetical protein
MSGPRFHTLGQSATATAPGPEHDRPECRQRLSIRGLKEKNNPIVVVEAVETGEIEGNPFA